ncbi:DUF1801 domain-containing protein [Terricaulis sp.]|uniref:DUF1801 domain-containing protein n=1 Tax=Terricaulis sp. TaxID=2768686 RepID=UPI00378407FB
MANAKIQTVKNKASVASFIAAVENEARRTDAKALMKIMAEETGQKATMWGPAIVGYGEYHYKYDSGREGDMPKSAFSPRKQNLVLYVGAKDYPALLKKLGKHKVSGSCLHINSLSDVDEGVLRQLIAQSYKDMTKKYG